MSAKTFFFEVDGQIDRFERLLLFDWKRDDAKEQWIDEEPRIFQQQFSYVIFARVRKDGGMKKVYGIIQFKSRKTEETGRKFFAFNYGLWRIVMTRCRKPMISPFYFLRLILNAKSTVVEFEKEVGEFQLGGNSNLEKHIGKYQHCYNQFLQKNILYGDNSRDKYEKRFFNELISYFNQHCKFLDNDEFAIK